MLFEEPAPRLPVRIGVGLYKRTHGSAKKHVRFREQALLILRVRPKYYGKFKDHALTEELGIPRTREAYALAGSERGHEQNYGLAPCLLGQKE
jgi:hypothetical protein